MNCEQFGDIVHDLLRNEALDTVLIEDAFVHAESCHGCDELLEEVESLTASLHSLAALHASEQASPSVENNLLREFKQKHATARPSLYRRLLVSAVVWTAAAAILLLSVALLRRHAPPVSALRQPAIGAALPKISAEPDSSPAASGESSADSENTAGLFVPLSDAFDVSSLDDATVVRVVLSRSAIESFGLPINESGDNQVIADLVLADDGIPQAIRVVSW